MKHLIPDAQYTVNVFAGRLDRLSEVSVIKFHTLPHLMEPDNLKVEYVTPSGVHLSWSIPNPQFIDGAVLSIYEKKLTGQPPIQTIHLVNNETSKYITGLKVN